MFEHTEPMNLQEMLDQVPRTETGAIDLTRATLIAEGGTHELYRFADADFVIKLMKRTQDIAEIEELERNYAVLYDCFDRDGIQRCIREQHIIHPVMLAEREHQNANLSFVPYEECFKSKIKFDFKIEPAELDPYVAENHKELFFRTYRILSGDEKPENNFFDEYKIIDERIGSILQRLDEDPGLRDTVSEFLTHYRDFYQRTNIILDAMGFENILFFKDESGDWQFKVGSTIKHDTGKFTNELFDELHSGSEVDLHDFVNFTHAYFSPANIRAVNVCAMKLGLEPVINDVIIDPEDLLTISALLSTPERMLAYARHGDFTKMNIILNDNINNLCFDSGNYWVYSQIADECIRHGQPLNVLKNFLDTVSELEAVFPENQDIANQIRNSKTNIMDRKIMLDKKIMLHNELVDLMEQKDEKHDGTSGIEISNRSVRLLGIGTFFRDNNHQPPSSEEHPHSSSVDDETAPRNKGLSNS